MVVLVDLEDDLGDIFAENPAKLALVIGMDEDKPTICLLGADAEIHYKISLTCLGYMMER
jgi:hypothetical protein